MNRRLILWLLAAVASFCAEPRSNFSGTWKLNEAASGTAATAPREIVWKIEHNDPRFKYSLTGKRGYMPFSEAYDLQRRKMPSTRESRRLCCLGRRGARAAIRQGWEGVRAFHAAPLGRRQQMTREGAMGTSSFASVRPAIGERHARSSRITKEYNRRAVVDHVSFTIDRGEVLRYLGPTAREEHDRAHADRPSGSDVGRSAVRRAQHP